MTAARHSVLLIEDESKMRLMLNVTLSAHGYRVIEAATGALGLQQANAYVPDLVLLDLGLPDTDGIEVTRRLRLWSASPILVISARNQEAQKVRALDAGADDYLTKPFGSAELLARIRVALRRAHRSTQDPLSSVLTVGKLRVDLASRVVVCGGTEIRLTDTQYRLLVLLVRSAGKVVTHRQLLEGVWGPGHGDQMQYLRVYVGQLRQKLEANPARPRMLLTEPGVGYRLRDDSAGDSSNCSVVPEAG